MYLMLPTLLKSPVLTLLFVYEHNHTNKTYTEELRYKPFMQPVASYMEK